MKRVVVTIQRVYEFPDDASLEGPGLMIEGQHVVPNLEWTMDDGEGVGIGVDGEALDAIIEGEVCEEARMSIDLDGEVATWGMERIMIEEDDDQIG